MSGFWIGLAVGMFIGGTVGVLIISIVRVAADTDRQADEWHQKFGQP